MSRLQLSINVSDFDAEVAFYSALFGTGPASGDVDQEQARLAGAGLATDARPGTGMLLRAAGQGVGV